MKQISFKYGISGYTVYKWFKGATPFGSRAGRLTKVPELLYLLGALLGDGTIYHWRGRFQVWLVGEEPFVAKFAAKAAICLERSVPYYKYGSKNAWFVRFDNAELYFLIKAVRQDHSLIAETVDSIDHFKGWKEFVEGFFDAEGCVKIIKGLERKTPKACLDVCNTDLSLLQIVQKALKDVMGIESGFSTQRPVPPRRVAYHLRIYSKAGISRYLDMLGTTKMTEKKAPIVHAWLAKRQ